MPSTTDVQVQKSASQWSAAGAVIWATASCILLFGAAHLTTELAARNVRLAIPYSLVGQSVMLASSLALAAWLSRGNLSSFGFTKGEFHFHARLLLWALVGTGSAVVFAVVSRLTHSAPPQIGPHSPLAIVLQVWIYASVCEEVFMRGLYQT